MKRSASSIPTFELMLLPTIEALQILGGSGTTEEIYDKVIQLLNIPEKVLEIPHRNACARIGVKENLDNIMQIVDREKEALLTRIAKTVEALMERDSLYQEYLLDKDKIIRFAQ